MTRDEMSIYIGDTEMTLVEAMKKIDRNSHGIIFIENNRKLIGSVTDGDIRRCLMESGELNISVSSFMNTAPKYLLSQNKRSAKSFMKKHSINAVPIISEEFEILDIVFERENENDKVRRKLLTGCPVVIMAGGKGTRLYPYTKILPKPLIPIGDIPIMERIINRLEEYGVDEFTITVNYKKAMIKSYFEDINHTYKLTYVEENKPLGTAGSLKLISQKFNKPFIVTNCDILIHSNYDEIMEYHKQSGNILTIVSALKNITVPYGVIHSKSQGAVTRLEEKPKLSYFVNTGMYYLNPECIDYIPDDTFFHMTDLINKLLANGKQVGTYPISEDSFLDMGEFEEMERMEEKLNLKSE